MAQSYQTTEGELVIPNGYASFKVQGGSAGLAQTGIIALVGEADSGPDYSVEGADLNDNVFGPNSLSDVVAKYKSGPLVDAVRACSQPADDPDLPGAPAGFLIVKTNPSTKASSALPKIGGGTYATLYDKSYGKLGNLIYYTLVSKTAEVAPTTGAFTYIPAVGTALMSLRVDGAAVVTHTIGAAETPTTLVTALDALTGVDASGGADRLVIKAAQVSDASTLAVAVSGNIATFTISSAWGTTPVVGDTLVISATSAVVGAANANVGAYVVTAASASTITATKLSDALKGGAALDGTITAPAAVSAQDIVSTTVDLICYTPVVISTASALGVVDGVGKTLEINELAGGTETLLLNHLFYQLGTTTHVTWVSKTGAATQLTSAAEYQVGLNTNRQVDGISDTGAATGGNVALTLGYTGTTCSVVVTALTMTLTLVGGVSSALSPIAITLKDFPTLADLAAYLGSIPGMTCSVPDVTLGNLSSLTLDEGTFSAATTWGNATMRLKHDAVEFFLMVGADPLVQQGGPLAANQVPAAAGLPDVVTAITFLSGAVRGNTTDAVFDLAVDALESCDCNFLVPLFSRDATGDVTDGLTASGSTYTVANVRAYSKTHCAKMSQKKRRKHRQGGLSSRGTYLVAKQAAATLATEKCWLAFQDVKVTGANGIVQAQPWMTAGLAAAMQAAGGYRAIFKKKVNCGGFIQAAGDFNPLNDDSLTAALKAGLLIGRPGEVGGGFEFVSDQTTYSKDNNFVYNSIQAVYGANTIARTLGLRMGQAMVGQSVADVGAPTGVAALEAIMGDLLRLKLVAPSDDAPRGYKNVRVAISGPVAAVTLEVKLAGAIYFVDVSFLVTQVQQTATA